MSIYDYVALVLIAAGWAIQLTTTSKKSSMLNPSFLTLYIIGSLMLAFNALDNRYIAVSLLNLTSAAIAAALMFRQQK
jgi:hypothetical protein